MRTAALLALVALVAGAPALAQAPGDLVTLHAQRQQWIQDQLWCGIGDVEIHYQDITLRCDLLELDLETMQARAEGNVVLDQGPARMSASRMEFDLRAKVGTLWDVEAYFPPDYHFRGKLLEKLDETHYRFVDGVFTSCPLDDSGPPPWSIEVAEALVELEGYGHFRNAAVKAKGVPVFWTPRLLWPVKRERAAGLLVPNIGYSSRRGVYLGNAIFWPISRSVDTTLYVDLYSKGYLGLGQEVRWAPTETARGEILVDAVRNADFDPTQDPDGNRWEWKVQGKHQQLFAGGWALRAELNDMSNLDFFQQFERAFDRNALRTLYSHTTLSRTWGPQAINLRLDHRETFFSAASQESVVLERLPEAEYRLRSTRIGSTPLYVSMVALADRFRINRSPTLRGNYARLDAFPTVSLLAPGLSWLNVTPTLGARLTHYTATYTSNRQELSDQGLTRRYATAGLSVVGPSFSRIFTTGSGTKMKHLIEPRLEYSYVSDPGDQSLIPVFDEKDSVLVRNFATWTLANRLFVKGEQGSREVATFEVSQDYSFSEPLTRPQLGLEGSQRGPVSFWLRAAPSPFANLDARATIDAVTNSLSSTSLSGGVSAGNKALNLTWYSGYDPVSGELTSSQTRVFTSFGPRTGPWRLDAQAAYDIHKSELLEHRYVLRYRGSCWSAYLEVRDYRIEPYKTRDYRISIDLTGLGTFLDIRGDLDALAR